MVFQILHQYLSLECPGPVLYDTPNPPIQSSGTEEPIIDLKGKPVNLKVKPMH